MIGTKEDIEDQIKSLLNKRNSLLLEISKIQQQVLLLEDKYLALDDNYIRVECFNPECKGMGYVRGDDKKLRECQVCNGKGFKWLKKYAKKENQETKE